MSWDRIIRLLEAFVDQKADFQAAHAADYQSESCKAAYEKQEDTWSELEETLMHAARSEPALLAAALRRGFREETQP